MRAEGLRAANTAGEKGAGHPPQSGVLCTPVWRWGDISAGGVGLAGERGSRCRQCRQLDSSVAVVRLRILRLSYPLIAHLLCPLHPPLTPLLLITHHLSPLHCAPISSYVPFSLVAPAWCCLHWLCATAVMEHQDLDSLSDAELQALIAQLSNPPPTPDVPVEAYHYNVPLPPLPPPPPSTSPMAHTPPPQPSPTSAHSAGAFPPSHPYLTTLYTPDPGSSSNSYSPHHPSQYSPSPPPATSPYLPQPSPMSYSPHPLPPLPAQPGRPLPYPAGAAMHPAQQAQYPQPLPPQPQSQASASPMWNASAAHSPAMYAPTPMAPPKPTAIQHTNGHTHSALKQHHPALHAPLALIGSAHAHRARRANPLAVRFGVLCRRWSARAGAGAGCASAARSSPSPHLPYHQRLRRSGRRLSDRSSRHEPHLCPSDDPGAARYHGPRPRRVPSDGVARPCGDVDRRSGDAGEGGQRARGGRVLRRRLYRVHEPLDTASQGQRSHQHTRSQVHTHSAHSPPHLRCPAASVRPPL